ncbi:MAG: hypothetical protein IJV17_05810 [Prevotella sp.]|nr:hypothetical protein [Prevotella sp.]
MNLFSKYGKIGASLLFGIAVFLFWRLAYPVMLSYQEQYQLFLMDGDYLCRLLSVPDGFARCVGEFLTQLYINQTLGALVLAVIFVLIQRLTWHLMKTVNKKADNHYALSFLPALLLGLILGDESVLLTYPIALILALIAMWGYETEGKNLRVYLIITEIPLLYWLAGPVVLLFATWVLLRQLQTNESRWKGIIIGVFSILYALTCILVSSWIVPYPLYQLFRGVDYYRFVGIYYWALAFLMFVCMILPIVMAWVPATEKSGKNTIIGIGETVILLAGFLLLRPSFYDARKYEVMEYDYLVRCQNWDAIIAKADRKTPDLPMTVCATNLALGMKGQLGERLFDYFQNGVQGLLPHFERNFSATMLTGEAYWQLGLVNTAQRFAFEMMEAIPNYSKSCRAVKRLAETNLVNGEYAVARKYLQLLEKTLSYRQWAQRTLPLLGDEKAINEHPVYGWMRQLRLQEDILFNGQELDKVFGQLMMQNKGNGLALQYLLAAPLLERDINKFMKYMSYVDGLHLGYRPRSCQEAIIFAYAQRNQYPPRGYVDEMVMRNFGDFSQSFAQSRGDVSQLGRFRNTAWYYLVGRR